MEDWKIVSLFGNFLAQTPYRIELGLIAWVTLEFETFCFITAYIYILKCSSANFLSFIPQIFSLIPLKN